MPIGLRNVQLRARREARGLTQQQLASAAGLSLSAIQNIESGRSGGNRHTWRLLEDVFRKTKEVA